MPRTRQRKTPVTTTSPGASTSALHSEDARAPAAKRTRTVIRRFHVLLKRQAQLAAPDGKGKARADERAEIAQEIEALGGLAEYQRMSATGQTAARGGSSAKILVGWLQELALDKRGCPLQLLDGGALRPDNYARWAAWIAATAMDLRARAPGIVEQDLLALDLTHHAARWDVLALSLVLNFVPAPPDRGRMLRVAHAALAPCGLMFVALPAPCVHNSRYLDNARLLALMRAVGFEQAAERCRPGGRMAYWLFRKTEPGLSEVKAREQFGKKEVVRTGNDRNNFSILL